jgi:hypothetical protein
VSAVITPHALAAVGHLFHEAEFVGPALRACDRHRVSSLSLSHRLIERAVANEQIIDNRDGTSFVYIPHWALFEAGAESRRPSLGLDGNSFRELFVHTRGPT